MKLKLITRFPLVEWLCSGEFYMGTKFMSINDFMHARQMTENTTILQISFKVRVVCKINLKLLQEFCNKMPSIGKKLIYSRRADVNSDYTCNHQCTVATTIDLASHARPIVGLEGTIILTRDS